MVSHIASAVDRAPIMVVVSGLTLVVSPLIGAYAGVLSARSRLRRLQNRRPVTWVAHIGAGLHPDGQVRFVNSHVVSERNP